MTSDALFNYLFTCINYSIEDSTNQYLNENWRPASEALRPIISKTIEDILLSIMQKIFHNLPAEYFVADLPWPNGNPNSTNKWSPLTWVTETVKRHFCKKYMKDSDQIKTFYSTNSLMNSEHIEHDKLIS